MRPTESRVREALASIWADRLPGARVLDLFAGSGAVGLEMLSRGAESVTFVERRGPAARVLARNLTLATGEAIRFVELDAAAALARLKSEGATFDLVFADPPYELALGGEALRAMAAVATPEGRLAIERGAGATETRTDSGWLPLSVRRYGDSELALFERDGAGPGAGVER